MASKKISVSSLISPDILKTISSATVIKTFGDQLVNQSKEKVIQYFEGKAGELKKSIEEIITKKIQVSIDHNNELKRLDIIYKNKQITEEQYNKAVVIENIAYENKIKDLEAQQLKFQQDLNSIISDPYKKLKAEFQARKAKLKRQKVKNKRERAKAKKDRNKKLILNAAKTLAPIIASQIINQLVSLIAQRGKLEILVNQVNAYILQANTPETITIAINLRNNTVNLINNSIAKLEKIQKVIQTISFSLTLFNILIPLLNRISPLTVISTPPLTPIPGMIAYTELTNRKQRLERLVSALSVVLAIATVSLENEIIKLNELIERLRQISGILDSNTLNNLNQQQLTGLTAGIVGIPEFPPYKGFNFKIKEDQNPAFIVKGNKRHYAVAIDRDGVEILKSEFSFTLDPQDLVDQLKLIIDQRNLQG